MKGNLTTLKITNDSSEAKAFFAQAPSKIRRSLKTTRTQITNKLTRELGGSIPRKSGTSVAGFRRVRVKKAATLKSSTIWLGGNLVAAKFGGALRNVDGGAMAGRHFFKGAFVATMKNGYTSIFSRTSARRLRQEKIRVIDLPIEVGSVLRNSNFEFEAILRKNTVESLK